MEIWTCFGLDGLFWPFKSKIWKFDGKCVFRALERIKRGLVLAYRPMNTVLAVLVQFWLFFGSNLTLYDPSDSEFGNFKKCFCSVPLNKLKNVLFWLLTCMVWFWLFWTNFDTFLAQIGQYLTLRNKIWKFHGKTVFRALDRVKKLPCFGF